MEIVVYDEGFSILIEDFKELDLEKEYPNNIFTGSLN